MFLLGMCLIIPILVPFVTGVLLGLGNRKTRSDLLALLISASILLIQTMIMNQVGVHNEKPFLLFPQTVPTTTILFLCSLSLISIYLIFPYIFAKWGVECVDRIRSRNRPTLRQLSKGRLLLGIMLAIPFVAIFSQAIPIMTNVFHEIREYKESNKVLTKSSNTTSNAASRAASKAVQD